MEWRKALSVISNFFRKCKGDGTKPTNKEWREYNLIEKIFEHTFFDKPHGFITKKTNSIWKFPDDSSGERTRHVSVEKKTRWSFLGCIILFVRESFHQFVRLCVISVPRVWARHYPSDISQCFRACHFRLLVNRRFIALPPKAFEPYGTIWLRRIQWFFRNLSVEHIHGIVRHQHVPHNTCQSGGCPKDVNFGHWSYSLDVG